jgi:hypothetical protein
VKCISDILAVFVARKSNVSAPPLPAVLACRRTSIFLVSQLVAVHVPELGSIQRLKHIADQIPLDSSFQILAADPRSGCVLSTLLSLLRCWF